MIESNVSAIDRSNLMLNDFLQDQAAAYVSGAMLADEREKFELVIEVHEELRTFVAGLAEVGSAVMLAALGSRGVAPSNELKARISGLIANCPQATDAGGIVMTGADGFVQWVNSAFVEMCGYSLDELRRRIAQLQADYPGTSAEADRPDATTELLGAITRLTDTLQLLQKSLLEPESSRARGSQPR